MNIYKPIFILGSGRSGTTLLYRLLAIHPDVYWFSNITNRYYNYPQLSIFHRLLKLPIIGNVFKKRIVNPKDKPLFLMPNEGEKIYNYCGFEDHKKTFKKDITLELKNQFCNIISFHHAYTKKNRFISKRTANVQRIDLINGLFSDAIFIHIIRDGRAIACSLMKEKWWKETKLWWRGGKTPKECEKKSFSPVSIAAMHWQNNVQEILQNKPQLHGRYFEVQYEELVRAPKKTIKNILKFCELKPDSKYLQLIPDKLQNMNYKWRKELDPAEKKELDKVLRTTLQKLGYKP